MVFKHISMVTSDSFCILHFANASADDERRRKMEVKSVVVLVVVVEWALYEDS